LQLYKIAGFVLGMTGIVIISTNSLNLETLNIKSPFLALLSAVLYGLYTVLGRRVSSRIGSLKMNSYSFLIGSLILLPLLLIFRMPVISFDTTAAIQVIYLSFFVTGLAYLTYFKGLTLVGASSGSLVFFLKPVLAGVFAIIFLREHFTSNLFIGTLFILFGIIIIIYWKDIVRSKVLFRNLFN
ncbi:MAG: DMT family transporter, partial [Clostridiaceae bacterium]|nr:DMT family transporter [Clostridiaceae bacterium]